MYSFFKTIFWFLLKMLIFPFKYVLFCIEKFFFPQILRKQNDTLEAPVIFYKHPETGRQIVFVAIIHIGEAEYYKAIQKLIDFHDDHVVLYEMIGRISRNQQRKFTAVEREEYKKVKRTTQLLKKIVLLLNLTHQKNGLVYRDHWINTDINGYDLVRALCKNKSFSRITNKNKGTKKKDYDVLKWTLNHLICNGPYFLVIARFFKFFSVKKKSSDCVILDSRNQIAVDAMFKHLQTKNVLVIWGAEHLIGIGKSIRKAGFQESGRLWFTAYKNRHYPFPF